MTTMNVVTIPMANILFDEEFNCRGPIAPIDVVDLAKNIQERGLIQPVVVTPLVGERAAEHPGKSYLLIAGYRRYTAFRINKSDAIPCVVRQDMGDEVEARFFNLSENLQRKDLNILQEAQALAKLKNLGITETEAAKHLNMSRGWVQVRYMVLGLPVEVQEEIAAGWISQIQIRDIYSHYVEGGVDACYETVRRFKDDKIKGRKNLRKKPKKNKSLSLKKIHDRADIFELQDHIHEQMGNHSIVTRILGWCAGEVSGNEIHAALEVYAQEEGKVYRAPKV